MKNPLNIPKYFPYIFRRRFKEKYIIIESDDWGLHHSKSIEGVEYIRKKYGYEKVDYVTIQNQLSGLIGENLLFMKPEGIKEILDENKLISEFTIQKKYPNTVNINLKEVNFVAKVFKDKKKYFLADNDNLISFKDYVIDQDLPNIYGKDAEYYFNDFQKLLKLNNFNLDIISSYYFFQINRWDLVTNNQKIIKFPSKGLKEAIKVANKLLNNKDFNKYSVIDLRINNKIITQ